jgi:hypothetical protein
MMMDSRKQSKKIGRPKSEQTLQKEAVEALLKDWATQIPPLSKEEVLTAGNLLESLADTQKIILEGYSPLLPHALIYEMESLGDESMQGYEKSILDRYEKRISKEFNGRLLGKEETENKAKKNARALWDKNTDLLGRIKRNSISINGAALTIHDQWDNKGIEGEDRPTVRTIKNWYKRINP